MLNLLIMLVCLGTQLYGNHYSRVLRDGLYNLPIQAKSPQPKRTLSTAKSTISTHIPTMFLHQLLLYIKIVLQMKI